MKTIKFSKMHGLGNDFVVIDCTRQDISDKRQLAVNMCARRFGVGADQLILIYPSKKADYEMQIYNPDGSNVEMCGNALRAVALYIKRYIKDERNTLRIDTAGGVTETCTDGETVTVNMGVPSFEAATIGLSENRKFINTLYHFSDQLARQITCVSVGNPHCIQFVKDTSNYPVATEGPIIERHSLFKNRTNVEFVEVLSRDEVNMRVWERGTGETLACGSGACAVTAACIANKLTNRQVKVNLPGGALTVVMDKEDDHIYMTGPATFVYDGVWTG